MGIHYNKIHEHPYPLWQWVLCVSMYITCNRTIDWKSGVDNDITWALMFCIRQHVNTTLVWDLHCVAIFHLNASTWSSNVQLTLWALSLVSQGSWKLMAMNDVRLITPLWCWMAMVCTLLYSWLYGVYWILVVKYCSLLTRGMKSFHNNGHPTPERSHK